MSTPLQSALSNAGRIRLLKRRTALVGSLLQHLVDIVLCVDRHFLKTLDNDSALSLGVFKDLQPSLLIVEPMWRGRGVSLRGVL